jgi:hypothetical protein
LSVTSPAAALTAAAEAVAGLTAAARDGGLDDATVLASLTVARRLAAELERSELALIEAARDGGATWSQIATAIGARGRQTAQKRHADLSRRYPRSPAVDTPEPEVAAPDVETAPDSGTTEASDKEIFVTPPPEPRRRDATARAIAITRDPGTGEEDLVPAPGRPAGSSRNRKQQADPKITPGVIGEGRYEIVKAPGHAESRAWHVLVGGKRVGLVRPTWRGERGSRPGWEAVDNAGTVLPVTGIGKVTAAGNARTRDAAAVSLLRALQRQQDDKRRRKGTT